MTKRSWLGSVLVVGLLASCGGGTPITRDNFSYLYGRAGTSLRLMARVYNQSEERSAIHFKLRTRELLYKSEGGGPPYSASVRIRYESFSDWSLRQLLDSASTLVRDHTNDPAAEMDLIGSMEMRRNELSTFVVRITATDLHRELATSVVIPMERGEGGHRQDFLPLDKGSGLPLFDDHRPGGGEVVILCERYAGHTLLGSWYDRSYGLPPPVFTNTDPSAISKTPDSTFSIEVDEHGRALLALGDRGAYHLRTDSTRLSGYTLHVLHESYPEVRNGAAMLPPLRYITSMQEFDQITAATDRRKAVERFWLDAAGSRDRARDAIRAYYSRVENANRFFTSHVEGWKSDRGLVHIIFGTPNVIHKGDRSETWIFGEETNLMSLTFTFVKRDQPFTDNDLVLERDPVLKGAWYRNVESWRNGRIQQN